VIAAETTSVRLTYGIHDLQVEVDGLAVAEVAIAYQNVLNLPTNWESYVNGLVATGNTIVGAGDRVEFMKIKGRKSGDYFSIELLRTKLTDERFQELTSKVSVVSVEAVHQDDLLGWTARITGDVDSGKTTTPKIDKGHLSVKWKGSSVQLPSVKQFRIFERLVRKVGAYVEVQELMTLVWGDKLVEKNAVQQAASRLQAHLHKNGMTDLWIDGKSCAGFYRLQIFPEKCEKSAPGQQHDNAVSAD